MDSIDRNSPNAQQRLAAKYAAEAEEAGRSRPFHQTPLFWAGAVLLVAVIAVFVFTDALAWLPRTSG